MSNLFLAVTAAALRLARRLVTGRCTEMHGAGDVGCRGAIGRSTIVLDRDVNGEIRNRGSAERRFETNGWVRDVDSLVDEGFRFQSWSRGSIEDFERVRGMESLAAALHETGNTWFVRSRNNTPVLVGIVIVATML